MDTKSKNFGLGYDHGQPNIYRVAKFDDTALEIPAHSVAFGDGRVTLYLAEYGRWTVVYSGHSDHIKEIIRLGEVPDEIEPTDEPEEGPDPRDNAVPADEIGFMPLIEGDDPEADLEDYTPQTDGVAVTAIVETIQNGVVTNSDTYAF